MEGFAEYLQVCARQMGLELSDLQTAQFAQYAALLREWNERMNLTAVTQPREIAVKHFIDSLTVFLCCEPKQEAKVIDIGSGAGLPGVPMKIYRPDLKLTALDSLQKRLRFLQAVSAELGLDMNCVHARAEEAGRDRKLRLEFDVAVARAVAPLQVLSEYCLPFVRKGGVFLALKGPGADRELVQAERAVTALGGVVERVYRLTLPGGSARCIVVIRREKGCPGEYPRHGGKIAKNPL